MAAGKRRKDICGRKLTRGGVSGVAGGGKKEN